jgi:acetyl/propionyl-CoA carboxylase alpha subunit
VKYYATVDDQVYEISIDHPDRISVDGVELPADMRPVGGGQLYSLLIGHASYEIVADSDGELRNLYGIMVSGLRYEVRVQDERSRRLALADRSIRAPEGELALKAPIPGLVVKTLVVPGQAVAEGETLLILEAMKMENEIRAPRQGTVHEVRIEPGMQVATGQVLLSLR